MKRHNLFWGSSYDRGLDLLLFMWPDILAKYPEAQLHIAYGWNTFDIFNRDNPERQQWKQSVTDMMNQKGIVHHGRIGKDELKKVRQECGIWVYPTHFSEISCMTALECQADGLVPVTMNAFALKETVGSGILIDGDIKKPEVQEEYIRELLSLMEDKDRWKKEQHKGTKFAKKFTWEKIAPKWADYFMEPLKKPLVSVVTVTNREGFWNIMADNLSEQSYDNFEWIIVDDYKDNRSEIASKYAKKYHLDIKYIHGDKATGKYKKRVGLSRANNTGWQNAKGELLVYIQDFILIPETGIEHLVDLYRHHPNSLLAPTDKGYSFTEPDFKNKEDWFNGKTDIIKNITYSNIRNVYVGIRKTENPFDFEMNYAGIPRHIVESMNGWYELMDDGEGVGFDNTDIASRALKLGYTILIDDTNVARCLDLDPYFPHTNADANVELYKEIQKLDPVRREG